MPRFLEYRAGEGDLGRCVRDVVRQDFRLVAHDIARAKYRTENGVLVNGEKAMMNRPLYPGDLLVIKLDNEEPEHTVPTEGPIDILYEDEDLIALNKPAGIVVHPSHGHFADTLGNFLAFYFQEKGDPHEIRTIGRLDKDTSGVILFGKSRTACAHLTEQSQKGLAGKTYLAVVHGIPEECGSIEAPISREYEEKIRRVVRDDGANAVTHYKRIRGMGDRSLIEVHIDTGRTHQIRVHMAHIGHPLMGDPIYGNGASDGIERAALHAWRSRFYQPFHGNELILEAEIPRDMRGLMTGSETV